MSDKEDIKKRIATYERRLQKLNEQVAFKGIVNVGPEILLEIEDIEAKIEELGEQLAILESSKVSEELPTALTETYPSVSNPHLPPKAYHRLIGRFDELDQVMSGLHEPKYKPMIAIVGLGGIGKTAVAREAVERCQQEKLFDHIVWASAKTERFVGGDVLKTEVSNYNFDQLLSDIYEQCQRSDIAQMPLEQKKVAVRSLLADKRVLVVMDNLETVLESDRLVDHMFQILGKGKLLITSRHRVKHDQVFTIDLSGFPEEESVTFLREESKARGIKIVAQARQENLIEIHQVTGGAPLAMKLVVGQMSRLPMDVVLDELREAKFKGQDYPFYRFIFKHSWDMLELNARKVLVCMSAFPVGIGGKEEVIRAVVSEEVVEAVFRPALNQLVLMSLVDSLGELKDRRYAIHQLTHHFILSDIVRIWDKDL